MKFNAHLPVPSVSTASTSASTSDTEKGLLVLRCERSDRLVFWLIGTIASASAFMGGIATNAFESVAVPSVDTSVTEGAVS